MRDAWYDFTLTGRCFPFEQFVHRGWFRTGSAHFDSQILGEGVGRRSVSSVLPMRNRILLPLPIYRFCYVVTVRSENRLVLIESWCRELVLQIDALKMHANNAERSRRQLFYVPLRDFCFHHFIESCLKSKYTIFFLLCQLLFRF